MLFPCCFPLLSFLLPYYFLAPFLGLGPVNGPYNKTFGYAYMFLDLPPEIALTSSILSDAGGLRNLWWDLATCFRLKILHGSMQAKELIHDDNGAGCSGCARFGSFHLWINSGLAGLHVSNARLA